ncbi:MAG: hypothetical protein ACLRSW_14420 [Christensenellaceae bacterium]
MIDDVIGIIILSVLTGFTPAAGGESPLALYALVENAAWWLVCLKFRCSRRRRVSFLRNCSIKSSVNIPITAASPFPPSAPASSIPCSRKWRHITPRRGIMLAARCRRRLTEDKADMLDICSSPYFLATIGMNLNFSASALRPVRRMLRRRGACRQAGRLFAGGKALPLFNKDSLRVGCGMMVRAEVVLISRQGIGQTSSIPPYIPLFSSSSSPRLSSRPLFLKLSYKTKNPLDNTPTPIEQQA